MVPELPDHAPKAARSRALRATSGVVAVAVVVVLIATGLKVATSEEATARRTTSVPAPEGSTALDGADTTSASDHAGPTPTDPSAAPGGADGQPAGQPVTPGGGNHPCPVTQADIPGVPTVANPFDPAQADVTVAFTNGTERYVQPAFFTKDGGTGAGKWQVRFTPPQVARGSGRPPSTPRDDRSPGHLRASRVPRSPAPTGRCGSVVTIPDTSCARTGRGSSASA